MIIGKRQYEEELASSAGDVPTIAFVKNLVFVKGGSLPAAGEGIVCLRAQEWDDEFWIQHREHAIHYFLVGATLR
jgi:hypothetical protein